MNWLVNIVKAFVRGLAHFSLGCKTASRLQSEALDRKLAFRQRFGLRIHLLLCKWCRRYGKQITLLSSAAHEHPDEMAEPISQKLSAEARDRIKQKLRTNSA